MKMTLMSTYVKGSGHSNVSCLTSVLSKMHRRHFINDAEIWKSYYFKSLFFFRFASLWLHLNIQMNGHSLKQWIQHESQRDKYEEPAGFSCWAQDALKVHKEIVPERLDHMLQSSKRYTKLPFKNI